MTGKVGVATGASRRIGAAVATSSPGRRAGRAGGTLIRPSDRRGPLHPHLASQAFARAQRAVTVTPIRFHDIRHTHATLLLRDRVPIKVVSERLGHSTPAFTLVTYQHVLPGIPPARCGATGHRSSTAHSGRRP